MKTFCDTQKKRESTKRLHFVMRYKLHLYQAYIKLIYRNYPTNFDKTYYWNNTVRPISKLCVSSV